jgi:hypothetical protein
VEVSPLPKTKDTTKPQTKLMINKPEAKLWRDIIQEDQPATSAAAESATYGAYHAADDAWKWNQIPVPQTLTPNNRRRRRCREVARGHRRRRFETILKRLLVWSIRWKSLEASGAAIPSGTREGGV